MCQRGFCDELVDLLLVFLQKSCFRTFSLKEWMNQCQFNDNYVSGFCMQNS